MNQIEYLKELKRHLSPLGRDERNRITEYYSELINDKIESGISEQEVLAQLGTPQELAAKILSESPEYEQTPRHEKNGELSVGRIIGFSILIPFAIIAIASLYVVAVSFAAAAVACQIGGVTNFLGSFYVMTVGFSQGLFQLGIAMFVAALGAFVGYGAWKFICLCGRVTIKIFNAYKRTYVKGAA